MKKRVVYKTKAVVLPDENGLKKQCESTYTPTTTPGYIGRADIYTLNFDATEYIYTNGRTYTISGTYKLYQYGVKIIDRPITAEDIVSVNSTGFPSTYNPSTLALTFTYVENAQGVCTILLQHNQSFSFRIMPAVYKKVCTSSNTNPAVVTFSNAGGTQNIALTGTISVFPENDPSLTVSRPLLLEDVAWVTPSGADISIGELTPIYNEGVEVGVNIPVTAPENTSPDTKYSTVTISVLDTVQSISVTQGPGTYYTLSVITTPSTATVIIDGDEVRTKAILAGSTYTYSVVKEDLDTITGTGVITEDTTINVVMQARLTIQPDPEDATVIINDIEGAEITLPYDTRYTYSVSKAPYITQYGTDRLTKNTVLPVFLPRTRRVIDHITTTYPALGRISYEPYIALASGDHHIIMAGEGGDRLFGAMSGTGGICEFDMTLTKGQKLFIYKINGSYCDRTSSTSDYNSYNSFSTVALYTGPTESTSLLVCVPGAGGAYIRYLYQNPLVGGAGYKGGAGDRNGTNVSGEQAANSYAAREGLRPSGCTGGAGYNSTHYTYSHGGSGYINTDLITDGTIKNVIQTPGSYFYVHPRTGNEGFGYFIIERIG